MFFAVSKRIAFQLNQTGKRAIQFRKSYFSSMVIICFNAAFFSITYAKTSDEHEFKRSAGTV